MFLVSQFSKKKTVHQLSYSKTSLLKTEIINIYIQILSWSTYPGNELSYVTANVFVSIENTIAINKSSSFPTNWESIQTKKNLLDFFKSNKRAKCKFIRYHHKIIQDGGFVCAPDQNRHAPQARVNQDPDLRGKKNKAHIFTLP